MLTLFFATAVADGFAFQAAQVDTSVTDTTSQKFGYIQFRVEPDTAYLYAGQNFEDPVILTDSTWFTLPVGSHRFLIFGEMIPDRRLNLNVQENDTLVYKIQVPEKTPSDRSFATYAAHTWDANLMVFSDDETLISIFGTDHFSYGSLRANLEPGVHRVRFESSSGQNYELFLEVNSYQLKTYEKYFKPIEANARLAGVIPGASQFYKQQHLKGISAIALMGVTAGLTFYYDSKLSSGNDELFDIRQQYIQANSEQLALELGNQLDEIRNEVTGYKNRRNVFRIAAILVYAASFVDAFREPENGFAKKRTFNPYRDFSVDFNQEFVEARVHINF